MTGSASRPRAETDRRDASRRRRGYVLLETVVATGLLVVGLAVIGAQVQRADHSVRQMKRRIRAIMLAEQQLAELDMGLVELDSVDEVEDGDFGPRDPDYGWLLTTQKTAIEGMYLLRLDILHHLREGEYRKDDFDVEDAETLYTVYAMRPAARPVNFAEDFGLNDDELGELSEKFDALGIEGLDAEAFNPRILQNIDFEQVLETLPLVLDALGMDASQLAGMVPPELLEQLRNSGLLGEEGISGLLGETPEDAQTPQAEAQP